MPTSTIKYQTEVTKLLGRLAGSRPPESAEILGEVHRLGVWSRGSIRPRGSLAVSASSQMPDKELKRVLTFVEKGLGECCANALLAVGEWGGDKSLDPVIALLNEKDLDPRTDADTSFYCLAALRNIGGPKAVESILDVIEDDRHDDTLRSSAIQSLVELATGGSVSDIDSTADPAAVAAAVQTLRPALASRIISALIERSEDVSGPFKLQYDAAEALHLFEPPAVLRAVIRELQAKVQPFDPRDIPWALAASGRHSTTTPDFPPGTIAVGAQFTRAGQKKAATEKVYIVMFPLLSKDASGPQPIAPCVYRSDQQTVVVTLQVLEGFLPENMAEVYVKAQLADGTEIRPVENRPFVIGGTPALFKFRISEPYAWAEAPRFIVTEEP